MKHCCNTHWVYLTIQEKQYYHLVPTKEWQIHLSQSDHASSVVQAQAVTLKMVKNWNSLLTIPELVRVRDSGNDFLGYPKASYTCHLVG